MVAAIIQARMGSTRLPGKVLRLLPRTPSPSGGRGAPQTVLAHVINRAQAIPGVDVVGVATTEKPEDDRVAILARAAGARVIRGPEHDVLGRFALAAAVFDADVIVRLTADCPLLDPLVAGAIIARFHEARRTLKRSWYASNVHPPSWYDGTDVEIFDQRVLVTAAAEAGADEREHVTTWMISHPDRIGIVNVACPDGVDRSALKLSVDTAADLDRVRRTFAALPDRRRFGWRDVIAAYARAHPHPAIIRAWRIFGRGRRRPRGRAGSLVEAFIAGGRDAVAGVWAPPLDDRATAYRLGHEDVVTLGHEAAP